MEIPAEVAVLLRTAEGEFWLVSLLHDPSLPPSRLSAVLPPGDALGSPELPPPQDWGRMMRGGGWSIASLLTSAFLGCLWVLPPGHHHALDGSITESMPPEVPARTSLSLPPDIDQFPFSSFISTNFQVGSQTMALPGRFPWLPRT